MTSLPARRLAAAEQRRGRFLQRRRVAPDDGDIRALARQVDGDRAPMPRLAPVTRRDPSGERLTVADAAAARLRAQRVDRFSSPTKVAGRCAGTRLQQRREDRRPAELDDAVEASPRPDARRRRARALRQ
jgi:hypothetical protein